MVCVLPRENKQKHVQLIKDRKMFESRIGEMETNCDREMILKFGRIVDLEELEQVTYYVGRPQLVTRLVSKSSCHVKQSWRIH